MGLDTTHGAWHGPYSSFNRFRERLAGFYGIPLSLMQGFYEEGGAFDPLSMVRLACSKNAFGEDDQLKNLTGYLPLKWDSFKPNPIHELLNHSDCDGDISPESCLAIADELAKLINDIHIETPTVNDMWFIDKLKQFEAGCREAAVKNETLVFQ